MGQNPRHCDIARQGSFGALMCFGNQPFRASGGRSGIYDRYRCVYVCVFVCVPREENPGSRGSCRVRVSFFLHVYAHLVLGEYLGHVLIQPVEFVPRREGKLLDFGMRDLQGRGSLLCDPWRGADGQTRPS